VVRGAGTAAAPSPSADELSAFRGEHGQVWGRLRCCSMPLEAQQQRAPILPLGGEKGKQRGQPDAEGDGPGEYAYGFGELLCFIYKVYAVLRREEISDAL
jgi:hypothetical protein